MFTYHKRMGLVLLFKTPYSREHQANNKMEPQYQKAHQFKRICCKAPHPSPPQYSPAPTLALGEKLLGSGKGSGQKQSTSCMHIHFACGSHYSCSILSQWTPTLSTQLLSHSREHQQCTLTVSPIKAGLTLTLHPKFTPVWLLGFSLSKGKYEQNLALKALNWLTEVLYVPCNYHPYHTTV